MSFCSTRGVNQDVVSPNGKLKKKDARLTFFTPNNIPPCMKPEKALAWRHCI